MNKLNTEHWYIQLVEDWILIRGNMLPQTLEEYFKIPVEEEAIHPDGWYIFSPSREYWEEINLENNIGELQWLVKKLIDRVRVLENLVHRMGYVLRKKEWVPKEEKEKWETKLKSVF